MTDGGKISLRKRKGSSIFPLLTSHFRIYLSSLCQDYTEAGYRAHSAAQVLRLGRQKTTDGR
jgi:hypothetical protein